MPALTEGCMPRLRGHKRVLAPMVDQSELAWRVLCRRYGADLCFTPMFHSRLFSQEVKYRDSMFFWSELEGKEGFDRPLVVQFCSNTPEDLLAAAKLVEGRCDAIDLNLGCPQGIARKGRYGAFLQDEWDLVCSMISHVKKNLAIPVTAKIRVFPEKEKTLAYARRILEAGADGISVHARTREQKGQLTGLADWSYLAYLRQHLPEKTLIFGNGNILVAKDFENCMQETGVDGVLSAEAALANPAIFIPANAPLTEQMPRIDHICREYIDLCKELHETRGIKSHLFRLLRKFFKQETNLRNQLGTAKSMHDYEAVVNALEHRVAEIVTDESDADILRCSSYIRSNRQAAMLARPG